MLTVGGLLLQGSGDGHASQSTPLKAGREQRLLLADAVCALLWALPRQCGLLFPGMSERPLSDMSLTEVLRRMRYQAISVHGFRSRFRDWCAETPGNAFVREVCEHALSHRLPDLVEAVYGRGDLLVKRVLLLQARAE